MTTEVGQSEIAGDVQPGGGAAAAAPPADWRAGLAEELRADPSLQAFTDLNGLAKSYIETKRMVGQEKVVLPKGDDDAAGWDALYKALGRPDSADGYQLGVPEGDDGAFARTFAGWAHAAGLSQRQAAALSDQWNAFQTQAAAAAQTQADETARQIRAELGAKADETIALAQRGAQAFGFNAEDVARLDQLVGSKGLIEKLAEIGRLSGEGSFAGIGRDGGAAGGFGGSAAEVQRQIDAKKADADFRSRLVKGDATAKAEWARLNQALADALDREKAA